MNKALLKQDKNIKYHFSNTEDFNYLQKSKILKTGHKTHLQLNSQAYIQDKPENRASDASLLTVTDVTNTKESSQNLTKDNSPRDMETKTMPDIVLRKGRTSGTFQRLNNNTGVAFSAYLGHVVDNMGIGHTIKCDQILLNDGNVYSPYTGTFTVPKTGVYFLTFNINVAIIDVTNVKLVVNNRNIVDAIAYVTGTNHHVMGGNSAIIRLNSGDKVWLEIYSNGGAELYSLPDYRWVTFSGFFLY